MFTEPAVPVGFDTRGAEEHERVGTAIRLCTATSFVVVPAIAIPTHIAGGLPQGVQVISGFYREDPCFEAADAIESRFVTFAPIEPRP